MAQVLHACSGRDGARVRDLERRMLASLPPRDLTSAAQDDAYSSSADASADSPFDAASSGSGSSGGGSVEGEEALQRLWWRHAPPGLEPAQCATPTDAALYARWASSRTATTAPAPRQGPAAPLYHTSYAGANDVPYRGGAGPPRSGHPGTHGAHGGGGRSYAGLAAAALVLPDEPAWLRAARVTQASAAAAAQQAASSSGSGSSSGGDAGGPDGSSAAGGAGAARAPDAPGSLSGGQGAQLAPPATPLLLPPGPGSSVPGLPPAALPLGPPVPGVPGFLQSLARRLPPAAPGQQPDLDLVLAILRTSPQLAPGGSGLGPGGGQPLGSGDALLAAASGPPGMAPPPGMGHPGAAGGKRGRGGAHGGPNGADEGDSDEDQAHLGGRGGPATNVFRQRQKSRLG